MLDQVERFFQLKHQIERLRRQRPRVKELHLSPLGKPTPPRTSLMDKAFLMQLRLHLEAQMEAEANR